ncbi:hypothetical protein [Bradyrhizobium sp. WSM1417]|uniref:hypothetical protein n=1 Tax=Bradyrhizobium sp. WSM1417 TaxID=754500 RepID=UPI0004867C39|nr:hypothetical protein [Bradyrhizobium sp. WSM1417]
MRFPMPNYPCDFEIPDAWIAEAGFAGFKAKQPAYRSSSDASMIPLEQIEPLGRFKSHPLDFRGFSRERLVRVLKGFVADDTIEAVPAIRLPVRDFCSGTFRYRVCNGVHRYYASIAAGFSMLPANLE